MWMKCSSRDCDKAGKQLRTRSCYADNLTGANFAKCTYSTLFTLNAHANDEFCGSGRCKHLPHTCAVRSIRRTTNSDDVTAYGNRSVKSKQTSKIYLENGFVRYFALRNGLLDSFWESLVYILLRCPRKVLKRTSEIIQIVPKWHMVYILYVQPKAKQFRKITFK